MKKCIYSFIIYITVYFLPVSIIYSQQIAANLKSLTKNSEVVLIGKVSKQESKWNKNKTRIYTEATLQVDEYLKGDNTVNSVVVTYPGGEVGGVGELYTHMPRFVNNEDVLVFLKKDENNEGYKVTNGEEGKIQVINDTKTGEKITSSNVRIKYLKAQIKTYQKEQ